MQEIKVVEKVDSPIGDENNPSSFASIAGVYG